MKTQSDDDALSSKDAFDLYEQGKLVLVLLGLLLFAGWLLGAW